MNGYGLMQEIERRSSGAWRPSPGSVYPALSQLEDEGLVRAEEADGRKQYALSDEGRKYVEDNRERLACLAAGVARTGRRGRRRRRPCLSHPSCADPAIPGAGVRRPQSSHTDRLRTRVESDPEDRRSGQGAAAYPG